MGKLIDTDKLKDIIEYCILANVPADAENTMEEKWNDWFQTVIDRARPVEAIPKDQYEARLKADLEAILVELQLEIEELKNKPACCQHYKRGVNRSSDIILQKINELKADRSEENDGNVDDN